MATFLALSCYQEDCVTTIGYISGLVLLPTKEVSIFLDMSSGSELKHVERVLVKALEEVFNEDQMKQAQTDDKQDDQSEEEHSHSSRHSVDHDEGYVCKKKDR